MATLDSTDGPTPSTGKLPSASPLAGANNPPPDAALEELYQSILVCKPLITDAECSRINELFMSNEFTGRSVRTALVVAEKSGEFFKDVATNKESGELFTEVIGPLHETAERLKALAELMNVAKTRLLVALCNHAEFDPDELAWHPERRA